MSAVVSKAQLLAKQDPSNRGPIELADLFCRQTSWRITVRFEEIFGNDDDRAYRLAQDVMKQEMSGSRRASQGGRAGKSPEDQSRSRESLAASGWPEARLDCAPTGGSDHGDS